MMYLKFLWSLLRHKWFVFTECWRLGIPWLGIIHDWSKFLSSEFIPYSKQFYGDYPNRADIHGDMRNILSDCYTAEGVKIASTWHGCITKSATAITGSTGFFWAK